MLQPFHLSRKLAQLSNREASLASRDLVMRSSWGLSYVRPDQRDAGTVCKVNLQCNHPQPCIGQPHAWIPARSTGFLTPTGTARQKSVAGPVDGSSLREPPSPAPPQKRVPSPITHPVGNPSEEWDQMSAWFTEGLAQDYGFMQWKD